MSDQFVAEIRIFPFDFPPTGWALCDGQLLPISQNTALFSLLGTTYGGDGKSTFALPNMQGSTPMQQGQGQGLTERFLGEMSGSETVTLIQSEMPLHNHGLMAANESATVADPSNAVLAKGNYDTGTQSGAVAFYQTAAPNVQLNPMAVGIAGGSQPHGNMQPYLTLNFCIALQGIFPQRP
jgi:microcystin-dependent protein